MEFGARRHAPVAGAGAPGGRVMLASTRASMVSALTLYSEPPANAVSLDDFESLAVERLKVLSAVEHSAGRGDPPDRVQKKLEEAMRNTHLEVKSAEDKELDNISHWVLRLAFAATEDLRKRFLSFEMLLFKHRFERRMDMAEVQRFMEDNKLGYTPIGPKELQQHYEPLRDVYLSTKAIRIKRSQQQSAAAAATQKPFDSVQHYKVPFTQVLDLVSKRLVFVSRGFAYVPETDLVSILVSRFRSSLSQKLAVAFRSLPYIRQEDRIRPLLKMLENAYVGPEYGQQQGPLTCSDIRADNLDEFAPMMPMCMREIHSAIKREHHIKYHARLQFQLFLKGIGLSMQDCLRYMQTEFAKRPTSAEVFQKKYAYSVRHSYGQEGKRFNYRPYSCMKIIMGVQPANSAEHHGCPFRTYDRSGLRRVLVKQLGISQQVAIEEILEKVDQKQYQIACRRHFEVSNPGADSGPVGNHPNAWFEESLKHFEAQNAKDGAAPVINATASAQPAGAAAQGGEAGAGESSSAAAGSSATEQPTSGAPAPMEHD